MIDYSVLGSASRLDPFLHERSRVTKVILIAEDEFGLAEVMAQILTERGHEVDLALNGIVALARMAARRPDLMVVDLMMPLLDGSGLLRRMRRDPDLRSIPALLMTALPAAIHSDVRELVQAVLVKPFTPEALVDQVERLLSR